VGESPNATRLNARLMTPRRRLGSAIAIVAALVLVLALTHHAITTFVVSRSLSVALGYDVRFADMSLGWSHATFTGMHIGKDGDPVLDADRIDVDYALRDIFPGGKHRYGFAGVAIDRPTFTFVRHADGTYNLGGGGASSSPPKPTQAAAEPLLFSARVRDGTIRLVDTAPLEPDLREQSVVGVSIDASVQSNARTVARVDGTLIGRRSQSAPVGRWPLSVRSVIDYQRGFAMHRFRAAQLPLRGMLNFLVHAKIARFDDGVMRDVDVKAYALDIDAATPFAYRLGGGGELEGAQIALGPLAKPVRDLHGHIDLFDDGVTTPDLRGTVAGADLHIRGGMYDFADVQFRLGIEADPQLAQMRTLFTFLRTQPIRGPMHLETLVTASSGQPLIRTVIASPRVYYDRIPLDNTGGTVDYMLGAVSFNGIHAGFSALQSSMAGMIPVNVDNGQLEGAVHVSGPAASLPYAQTIAAGQTIGTVAILGGSGRNGFHANGEVTSSGGDGSGEGLVALDQHGVGEFGPFLFQRRDGSSLAGAFRIERPTSSSGGWAVATHYRFAVPAHIATLPGVDLTGFPAIGGIVDAAIVAGGPPSDFEVAGHVQMHDAAYDRYALGTVGADLSGTFADLRMRNITLDGPRGAFRGDGAVAGGTFGVRGVYDGSLEDLQAFTGDIGGHGRVHAPAAAFVDEHGVTVQTSGATLAGGSIHGIALGSAAGTLRIAGTAVRIITGTATLDGAHAVVAAHSGDTAISMVGVPASAFAGSGLPLAAGRVSVFGIGNLERPAFRGSIDLDAGAALGFPIAGWVDIAFDRRTLSVRDGIASIGGTYGRLGGRIDDIGTPAFNYDLDAGVALGDVGELVTDFRLPVRYAEGSFDARVQIVGGSATPTIQGTVHAPEGSYNGLAFSNARGRLFVQPGAALRLDDGHVTIGSTVAAFRASAGGSVLGIAASSAAADLSDFDDYFDESEIVAGRGPVSFAFLDTGRATTSSGRIALTGTRIRRFPLGDVAGKWSTRGGTIAADLAIDGAAGRVHTSGTVVPVPGGPFTALRGARYDADIQAANVDVGTLLPAAGFPYPVLGRLTAVGHLAGVFPHLAIGGHASLAGGSFGAFPIASAAVTTRILGNRVSIDAATADLGFVKLTASGEVGLFAAAPLQVRVHASVPDLALAARRIEPRTPIDIAGSLESDALIGGSFAAPKLTAGFDLVKPRYGPLLVQRIVGNGETDLHSFKLDSAQVVLNHGSAVIAGSLPVSFNPAGIGPANAPLSITADAHSVDLAGLAPLVPGAGTKLSGTVDGHLALEGTVRSPRVLGTVTLANASYVSSLETAPIRAASARLNFQGTTVALEALHAQVGSGSIDAHGQIIMPIPGVPKQGYSVAITAKGAQINLPAYGGGTLDGTAQLVSGDRMPTLSGNVALTHATIPFDTIFRAATTPAVAAGSAPIFDLAFNLNIDAKSVRIKSSIIDVGAAGTIDLTGTLLEPRAAGTFTAARGGVFSTYQRLFRIQDATVTFDPNQGIVPTLDLRATAHVDNPDPDQARNAIGSADITVALTGPADAYTIAYSSQPAYSQAQIIALLVDLPVLGSVNFGQRQAAGHLRGAPGESDAFLPPGVTLYQPGTTTLQEEAFSLLNTQLTQRLLSPLENAFGGAVGLTDLQLTLDYGGRVGYTARQQLSRKHAVYATLGQILSYPTRTQVGFQSRPDPTTTISFTYFQQNGTPYFTNSIFGNTSSIQVVNGVQPLSDRQGFNFVLSRTYP
jgi:hypothetical protein